MAITRRDSVAAVAIAVGGGLLVDGLLFSLLGTSDVLPGIAPGPATWSLAIFGGVLALAGGLALGARIGAVVAAVTPRLYPYGSTAVNLGVFLALLVSAVAVYAGFFEMFVGAHDNGDFGSLANQTAVSVLIDAATGLLWVVTGYSVLLIHRMVSIGRYLETPGAATDTASADATPRPAPPRPGWAEPPAAGELGRRTLVAASVGLAFTIAAAIQIVELGLAPASATDWWAGQVLLPAMPLAVVFGTGAIARGVGEMERRFTARWSLVPDGATVSAPAL